LDLRRSIPSVVDGLKPSQRKVIHTLLRRSSNKEIKVNQLAAAVALNEAYHHGEAALVTTIVRLAQDFVGMNNVPFTRLIFPAADDDLLHYLEEENQLIEPEWYCPIVPMILVNGAEGIATGWSTRVLSHDIRKVIDNVRRLIDNAEMERLIPSFSDFSGRVQEVEENRYEICGKFIFSPSQRKNAHNLSGYKEHHTERGVRFVLELSKEFSARCRRPVGRHSMLMKTFKLQTVLSTNSMVLFDPKGHLRNYATISDIMREHFRVRRQKYEERKEHETRMLDAQRRRLENQVGIGSQDTRAHIAPHS
uniref:DNA topoisomerase (ATP-hydrolyzing) n=1 Tax=Heligmosomoides polygyrus TaxID=6339 RepID=A0A183GBV4_HELPZ